MFLMNFVSEHPLPTYVMIYSYKSKKYNTHRSLIIIFFFFVVGKATSISSRSPIVFDKFSECNGPCLAKRTENKKIEKYTCNTKSSLKQ